jgi:uncharacterized membrane protein
MSKRLTLLFLGIIIILMPFLGFPSSWKNIFFVVVGLVIVLISLAMRREEFANSDRVISKQVTTEVYTEVFSETKPKEDTTN